MSKFKVGDKVRVIDPSGGDTFTLNEICIVEKVEAGTHGNEDFIRVEGHDEGMFAYRFKLVQEAYPILKPFQRVRTANGQMWIVCNEEIIAYANDGFSDGGWTYIQFDKESMKGKTFYYKDYNIVEVFDPPKYTVYLAQNVVGKSIWKACDPKKTTLEDSVAKATEAVQEAAKQLEAAKKALQEYK